MSDLGHLIWYDLAPLAKTLAPGSTMKHLIEKWNGGSGYIGRRFTFCSAHSTDENENLQGDDPIPNDVCVIVWPVEK